MFLIDTNVISELRKGDRCDARVAAWYAGLEDSDLFLSVLVIGEIRKGVELARPCDNQKAGALERWLQEVERSFGDRILPIDTRIAEMWGAMSGIRPIPVVDGLLAATAKTHALSLATRNSSDVQGLGAAVVNPFDA
jgi:predicted nucleic acid-binding protein